MTDKTNQPSALSDQNSQEFFDWIQENKPSYDSPQPFSNGAQMVASQTPASNKPLGASLSDETIAWLTTINNNMKRMSEDEEYRLEIAKNLS